MKRYNRNRKCSICCEKCGTLNEIDCKRIFNKIWGVGRCTKCDQKLKVKNNNIVLCPNCGKLVKKDFRNLCPACKKLIYQEGKTFRVVCKNCGIANTIPFDHPKDVVCVLCGHPFRNEQLIAPVDPMALQSQYIVLIDQQAMMQGDWIVWQHPLSNFPAGSQIQVNEGTWGLVLQNGICYPCSFSPQRYSLNMSDKSQEEKLAAAALGENIALDTKLYCMLQILPEIDWGTPEKPGVRIMNKEETKDYRITAYGKIIWEIADPRTFLRHFGFKEHKGKNGLLKVDLDPKYEDGALINETRYAICMALKNATKHFINENNMDPIKLVNEQSEIGKLVVAELDKSMTKCGLVVDSMKLIGFEVQENNENKQ